VPVFKSSWYLQRIQDLKAAAAANLWNESSGESEQFPMDNQAQF